MEQKICFEVQDLAKDENGNLYPAGFCITMEVPHRIPFEKLQELIDIKRAAEMISIIQSVNADDCRLIPEEEYDEKYGI